LKVRLIRPRREPISAFWHLTDIRVRKAIRPQAYYRRSMESTSQGRHRGLTVIGVLMILFGGAEVITGFTHKFFGISTAIGVTSTFLASGIGTLYAVAGLLVVTMRRWAASLALACLVVVVAGRIALVVTGLFPLDSFEQLSFKRRLWTLCLWQCPLFPRKRTWSGARLSLLAPRADAALFIQLAPLKPSSLHRTRLGNHVARFSDCASCGKTGKARQPFAAFQSTGARSTCRTLRCFQHIKLEKGRSWSLARPIYTVEQARSFNRRSGCDAPRD
jgi:hypothetical protein